ncbi:hypothetical protein DFH09DRAFT_1312458 [Mycena vulgaris]|nr:hypothetical protein DFH09DRAFT_1339442 [Mycena vulgaris]KAJ6573213.1 hypothetical protein DFH09DRAFT_1312458 [Mycena vulgaris]
MSSPYYCSPPLHADPGYDPVKAQGVWLAVSPHCRTPGMGCYTSWESCRAACEGVPGGGGVFYRDQALALPAWHARCRLGQHDHAIEPKYHAAQPKVTAMAHDPPSTPKKAHIPGIAGSPATPRNTKPPVPASPLPASLSTKKAPRMPAFEHSGSPPPSFANPELPAFAAAPLSTPGVAALMPPNMHFAVRGGEVVHSRLSDAMNQYTQGVSSLGEAALMATSNPFKAMFFSTGSTESAADELGALAWNLDMMEKEREKEEMEREVAFLAQRQLASTRRKAAIQQALREVSRIKAEDEGFDTGLGIAKEWAESADMEEWMLDNRRDVRPEEDFDPRFENQPADDL